MLRTAKSNKKNKYRSYISIDIFKCNTIKCYSKK